MAARCRSLRPDLFESDAYVSMKRDPRRVLIELMCLADDEGRVQGSARHLRSQRYTEDDDLTTAQIEAWIAEVEAAGWIRRYQVGGNTIAEVIGWRDYGSPTYQSIDRPKPSRLPAPPLARDDRRAVDDRSTTDRRPFVDERPKDRRSIDDAKPEDRRRFVDEPASNRRAIVERSTTDLDLDLDLDLDHLSAGAREPSGPVGPHGGACTEREWLALWTELAAGQGRVRDVMMLSGTERASLFAAGQPAAWWRSVLEHVARSPFLRGEERGFVLKPAWVLETENAAKVLAGDYDRAPPPGTVRTPDAGLGGAQLERLTAWCEGWSRGAGTEGHVPPAEAPSTRTAERDRVLSPLVERWAATADTAAWATGKGAEGAAAFLRSQVSTGKRRGVPDLAKLARSPVDLEEALRRGESYRRAAPRSAPTPTSSAPPAPVRERAEETPERRLSRLRAIKAAGMGGTTIDARIAAAEAELLAAGDRGETRVVLDDVEERCA